MESEKDSPQSTAFFCEIARNTSSPKVRLALASALQRQPVTNRFALAEALLDHAEDAADDNLPLMMWYGVDH